METNKPGAVKNTTDREIVITRLIDVPRELVWQAMIDPEQVVKWWGPNGFTTTIHEMDVCVGGIWKHTMHGPDGKDYPNKSIFVEIVKPERVVYKHAGGIKERGGACFMGVWTFEEQKRKTKLTMRLTFASSGERDHTEKEYGAIEGGQQTLNRLAIYLAKVEPFIISRTFDAPLELVWRAWTEPERMAQWWGPKGSKVVSSKMDFRKDGIHHYCMEYPKGSLMWGLQVYRHIEKPEKIVFVNSFSDQKGSPTHHSMSPTWPLEMLTTIRFSEANGKTTVDIQQLPIEATDDGRKTFTEGRESMKQGWGGSLDQLAEYLAKALGSV